MNSFTIAPDESESDEDSFEESAHADSGSPQRQHKHAFNLTTSAAVERSKPLAFTLQTTDANDASDGTHSDSDGAHTLAHEKTRNSEKGEPVAAGAQALTRAAAGDAATPERSPKLEPAWLQVLGDEFNQLYMLSLRSFLQGEKKKYPVYPPGKDIFRAFWLAPFDRVKVVILGQDPYHGPNQAHGLCFSVQRGVRPPPSLQNIFQELNRDLGVQTPRHGDLSSWAEQGVLLLNTVLTVRGGEAGSHAGKGWEQFTDRVIYELNKRREHLVFVLWGKPAQTKESMIDARRHLILKSAHPSPYSAHYGFHGNGHFSKINAWLAQHGESEIQWTLPE